VSARTSSGLLAIAGWSCAAVALRAYGRVMTNVPSTGAPRPDFGPFFADMFAISDSIRYVAAAHGQQLEMRSRPDLQNASSSNSDLYEELLVNPTLLTLATRRGNIDCGGLRYLIVGYGHFEMLVIPTSAGHVGVGFELGANPTDYLNTISKVMANHGQPTV
jgi:hypothetical protein